MKARTAQSDRKSAKRTKRAGAYPGGKDRLRVLFTCVGRRVELLEAFRAAAGGLGIALDIHGADVTPLSPALQLVDKPHLVPRLSDPTYADRLVALAKWARIDAVIPLIDPELPILTGLSDRLADVGCRAIVSSPDVIRICGDKLLTYAALKKAGIDTPQTWSWEELVGKKRHRFPYFLKPRAGSAAQGNYKINNGEELITIGRRVPDAIVQEFVAGAEHTLDVYAGFDGRPRCIVPRKRLEVRTGEVSKGIIVKDPKVMAVGRRVVEMLGGCRGVVTVQCMVTPRGRIRAIEINPRFGGGAPLAIHAGADFPRWILSELMGVTPRIRPTGFTDDIAMLRFDHSVFVKNASKLVSKV